MRFEILKINEVAPEIFDFLKVALASFEFDTPALNIRKLGKSSEESRAGVVEAFGSIN